MDWRIEVLRRAVSARVPFGFALRRLKRLQFGYEPDPANLRGTLSNFEQMVAAIKAVGRSFEGATVLEISSGWFPTIPVMLAMSGAKRILMSDLIPHMDEVTFAATLRFLQNTFPTNSRLNGITRLSDLPITYMAPFRANEVADGTINFVISRVVLEHIPQNDLVHLLTVLRLKLAPDGLMVHVIDNSDHLEHSDKSISKINFLTWTKGKHALINSLMKGGENRLRHQEYPRLFESAGFQVISAVMQIHEPTREIVGTLPLAAPYSSMSADNLAALGSIYVLASIRPGDGEADAQPVAQSRR